MPERAFWDLDLYRFWMWQGLHEGIWQGIDTAWVYPPGALLPMLVAAAGGTVETSGYATAWSVGITLLDAVAVFALLHTPAWAGRHTTRLRTTTGAWWWVAFIALLGPVAMGRLDAAVAPVVVVALVLGLRHPWLSSALLTAAAWIKVAPGALLAPLFLAARRPSRDVVIPAAAVSVAVVGSVAALGGLPYLTSFLTEQGQRGLQIEAVGATPWLLTSLWSSDVMPRFNEPIVSWELVGPGTQLAADTLGALFFLALAGAALFLWWRRSELEARLWREPRVGAEMLVRGALLISVVLIAFNKVGSPQYIGWLAPPVAVALALRLPRWRTSALLVALVAGLTQLVFPWAYDEVLTGSPFITLVLAARNVAIVVLLAHTVRELLRQPSVGSPDVEPDGSADEDSVAGGTDADVAASGRPRAR